MFDRFFRRQPVGHFLELQSGRIGVHFKRHPRARRYVLRLGRDGMARVTIPRGGSTAEARSFAERNVGWIEKQLQKANSVEAFAKEWKAGTQILFRGETAILHDELLPNSRTIHFADQQITVADGPAPVVCAVRTFARAGNFDPASLRQLVETHLWKLASRELPPIVAGFARVHGLKIRRVSVRNQKSRWGSCSRRGTISLNWRLVQTPAYVRDYIILHELAHLKEMNHSKRFWAEVERICPEFRTAEDWLRKNSAILR